MSSKIKVDTIENVAGSGNVSLGSGHNLVVPGNQTVGGTLGVTGATTLTGDLTVDTNNLFVDASAEKVFVNRTTQTKTSDAFVVSSPAGGVGGGNNRVDMIITAQDLTGDGGANANAFVGTKAKGTYYSGLEMSSTSGHVGGWIGHYGASASTRALEARVGGTGLNASDVGAMRIDVSGRVTMPQQPMFALKNTTDASHYKGATIQINQGSHWDNVNGKFTAPIAGKYYFFGGLQSSGAGAFYWALYKNGTMQTSFYNDPNGGTYLHASVGHIISLAASDYVEFKMAGSQSANTGGQNHFSGFLIG